MISGPPLFWVAGVRGAGGTRLLTDYVRCSVVMVTGPVASGMLLIS